MSGLIVLDVVIGLVFIYLLISLFCTIANEWIAQWSSLRAAKLRQGVMELLNDPKLKQIIDATGASAKFAKPELRELKEKLDTLANLGERFYAHPLVQSLKKGTSDPSYISSETFARTLLDLLKPAPAAAPGGGAPPADPIAWINALLQDAAGIVTQLNAARVLNDAEAAELQKHLDGSSIKKIVDTLAQGVAADYAALEKRLGGWFDEGMERVTGWYKRNLQYIGFFVALAAAVVFNADTINIATVLAREPAMRTALVESAKSVAQKCAEAQKCDQIDVVKQLQDKERLLPLGWYREYAFYSCAKAESQDPLAHKRCEIAAVASKFLLWLLGVLLTALAATLGAPFWFDLLKKLVNIRSAGIAPKPKKV